MNSIVAVQGPPRSGKTTLVKRLLEHISVDYTGFITLEVRRAGKRVGFDLINLNTGIKRILARKAQEFQSADIGSYKVYVNEFEEFLDSINFSSDLVIIDEIGKMECLSDKFVTLLNNLIGNKNLIVTIPTTASLDLVNKIRKHQLTTLFSLTKQNRNEVFEKVIKSMQDLNHING